MKDVLSRLRPFPEDPAKPYRDPYPPPRKRRRWKVPALLLAGAVLGAAPFLFHTWGGQHSRKLSFEHALSIAMDPSSPEVLVKGGCSRLLALGENGFASIHGVRRQRSSFGPIVRTVLDRLAAVMANPALARRKRPNELSFADALRGLADPTSGRLYVQTCLDLLAYDLEEAVRFLQVRRKKGGEPGKAAASILSWFRRFLEGH